MIRNSTSAELRAPPPAKKPCSAKVSNGTTLMIANKEIELYQICHPTITVKQGEGSVIEAKSQDFANKKTASDKKSFTALATDPSDVKVKQIKLRTHDGKDLGQIEVQILSEQANSFHGKVLKLTKLNTETSPIVQNQSTAKVATIIRKVSPALAATAKTEPVKITPVKFVNQKGNTLRTLKPKPTASNKPKVPLKGEGKLLQHVAKNSTPSSKVQTRNSVKMGKANKNSNIITDLLKMSHDVKVVTVDQKEINNLLLDKKQIIPKNILLKCSPLKFPLKSKPLDTTNLVSETVTEAKNPKSAINKPEAKTILINNNILGSILNGSTTKPRVVVLNSNQISQLPLSAKVNVKTKACLIQKDEKRDLSQLRSIKPKPVNNHTKLQSKIKPGQNVLICVNKNTLVPQNIIVNSQKNMTSIPIQNVIPMITSKKGTKNCNANNLAANKKSELSTDNRTKIDLTKEAVLGTERKSTGKKNLFTDGKNISVESNTKKTEEPVQVQESKDKNVDDTVKKERLSIIEKAFNSISDEDLREKALRALAACGISIERRIPIASHIQTKTVYDSVIQTEVFGLLDKENFILVKGDTPKLKRIQQVESEYLQPATQDVSVETESCNTLTKSNTDMSLPLTTTPPHIDNGIDFESFFNDFCNENIEANQVKQILSPKRDLYDRFGNQLQKDFESLKQWDVEGFLGIHKATIDDNTVALRRLLVVLQACKLSIDVETLSGKTSLELAIEQECSIDIIKELLSHGADPLPSKLVHDSAVGLACKQSSPHLPELLKYVKDPGLLNRTDSEGLAPLHYCAMRGNYDGVIALLQAKVNINLTDNRSGRTGLFHAMENNHLKVSQLLLENGADVHIQNLAGHTVHSLLGIVDKKVVEIL